MSSSNYRRNKAAIDQYHKELMAMLDDVREIDIKILNQAVNEGMRHAKDQSPVITGFFRKIGGLPQLSAPVTAAVRKIWSIVRIMRPM